jgi:hypothetical protein
MRVDVTCPELHRRLRGAEIVAGLRARAASRHASRFRRGLRAGAFHSAAPASPQQVAERRGPRNLTRCRRRDRVN